MLILIGVLAVLGVIVVAAVSVYNNLVNYRIETENAWSQIDVQLKRRYDLIPNLVETVKGIMNFERDTLTKVMEARNKAMSAPSVESRLKSEGEISGLLGRLFAVWENYPVLKSNQNAMQLQEELTTTENRIAYARGHHNDVVSNFNSLVEQFPSNIIANFFSFTKKTFIEAIAAEQKAPQVKL